MAPIVEENQLTGQRMTKSSCIRNFVPLTFAVFAIILGTAPNLQCETVSFTQTEGNDGLVLLTGPLSYRTRTPNEWPDSTFASTSCRQFRTFEKSNSFRYDTDAKTKTVWSFAILTPLLGACLIVKAFFSATCGRSPPGFRGAGANGGWKCMGFFFLVTSAFQGLNLLIDTSSICVDNPAMQYLETTNPDLANTFPDSCDRAMGYTLQIVAVVLWALAGLATFVIPEPEIVHEHPQREQTVTYTQKPDGTIVEAHVVAVEGTPVEQKQL